MKKGKGGKGTCARARKVPSLGKGPTRMGSTMRDLNPPMDKRYKTMHGVKVPADYNM